ncbi:MAG: hypothetical protein KF725_00610 [Cyclobacteriaceae bacterium]|nr:hypothetical protein [Cyclobacteriaceae bacterium]UYN87037.1 MAG: hypothetical protein KIT51_01795 [Cyclobacteriaceae bacterium]
MEARKKFVLIFFIVLSLSATGQSVKVEKESHRIKGENVEGYAVELEGKQDDVATSFNKYLRSFAKLKLGANPLTLTETVINGTSYKSPIYATTKERTTTAVAWIGLKPGEWANTDEAEKVHKELERIIYDFGVKYYRDKIQVQVDESTKALQAVERQQQRLVNEQKNLTMRLENNEKEKAQLEKSIEANKLENLSLQALIEKNKKSQDSVAIATEQIKRVVEMHKEKQKKVN